MSKRVKIELNDEGIIELFKSPEMLSYLQEVGDSVADTAEAVSVIDDSDYGARAHLADRTAIVNVYPDNEKAAVDNLENNTLVKALGASGLPRTKPKLPR